MVKKKFVKGAIGLGTASIGLGVTSDLVEDIGGDAAPLATLGTSFKPAAMTMGAGMVIDTLQDLNKSTKKKTKRR